MVCIATLAAYDSGRIEAMGLRRALLSRRANLGDCPDALAVLRRIASPRPLRHPACVVPLPRRLRGDLSSAELAVQVARTALVQHARRHGGFDPHAVGALIYCHASPDARTTDSTAGRLQFELELRRACAFSVSQAHNTATLIALDMAAGFTDGPESSPAVLLVAADKLLFGKAPHAARHMVWSDVAAAAVLTREASTGWRIEAIRLSHFATACDAHGAWPAPELSAFAEHAARAIAEALAGSSVTPADLAAVVTGSGDPGFTAEVHRAAGLAGSHRAPRAAGLRAHHAACADVLARLAGLEGQVLHGQAVLAWCHGNNGEFACAVMTRIG